jgi:hypothetical protein
MRRLARWFAREVWCAASPRLAPFARKRVDDDRGSYDQEMTSQRRARIRRAERETSEGSRFPATQRAAWETIWIPQPALLGDEEDVEQMAASLSKIQRHAKDPA